MTTEIQQVEIPARKPGAIKIEPSLMKRAMNDETEAIEKIFKQFLPENENILAVEYLGVKGLWGIGNLSFACATNRRVAAIRRSFLGEVIFQDGCMEYINSGIIYQPSKFWLYVTNFLVLVPLTFVLGYVSPWLGLLWLIIGFLLLPVFASIYYNLNKCGLVFWIREGVSVYLFTDRGRLIRANRLYRMVMQARELRVREIGHGI